MAVTPQTNATIGEIAEALAGADDICICGHVNPDGDCLGSQLALAAALRALGKRVACLLASTAPVDQRFAYLPGIEDMVPAASFDGPCSTFVAVDTPTLERLGDGAAIHDRAELTVTIDHHAVDARMSDLSYTDPDVAATAQLAWGLVGCLPVKADAAMATCCYTGLMTDTGRFQYQNTDAAALQAAAQMVAVGADAAAIACAVYQQRSLASVQLEARALERMRLLADGQAALSWVTRDDMDAVGASKPDTEPLIDALRNIAGVRVACMLREEEGQVRGSLRAKDGTDVAALAQQLGGGGHRAAAGFTIEGALDEALERVQPALESLVGQPVR